MAQDRDIKYINKDFGDFRSQLIEYAKNYFPDSYNDFSPTSPGMMFIEMAAYVGDVLSFYQDTQLQETYLQHAKNPTNLYNLAYMMGYRPKITTPSEALLEVSQLVGASSGQPNFEEALYIPANTIVKSTSKGGTTFIIENPIDFTFSSSYDPTDILVETLAGPNPSQFRLTKTVKAVSGEVKVIQQAIQTSEKFKTITIADTNIIGIQSITDSENNIWYEVPFLGQETIFTDNRNIAIDSSNVPYTLALQNVPRRFVTRFKSTGQLEIQFGSGVASQQDAALMPNLTNAENVLAQGPSRKQFAYDPSNYLHTQTYGLAPSNTTLTIKYLAGGGVESNVPSNTIDTLVQYYSAPTTPNSTTNTSPIEDILETVVFNNSQPAIGGKDGDSIDEIRENTLRSFNEQDRVVTLQDYSVRVMSMGSRYGSVAKVYITQDELTNQSSNRDSILDSNPLALSLYTLAYDNNKNLIQSTPTLKSNLKTYLSEYIMMTDSLNLKDAFVVNIEIEYEIVVKPNFVGRDVLLSCTNKLKEYFNIDKWSINQPINLSSIYTILNQDNGVQTAQGVRIFNKVGGRYSQYAYDILGATRNNIVYPSYDPSIFEIKFPDTDIKGRITTL